MSIQPPPNTITDAGMPGSSDEYALTVGAGGPLLLQDADLLTKVWPHKDYSTIPISWMVLNRNPENFFAQVTQVGFEVSNFVPGIGPSPEKMVLGRLFAN